MRGYCVALLSVVIPAAFAVPARAGLYLKYGDIQGDVTVPGLAGSIELSSFSLSISRAVSPPTGASSDRNASSPLFSDVSLSALSSIASVPLFTQALGGKGEPASIVITQTFGKGLVVPVAEWDFDGAIINSFATADSDGGLPQDVFSLNFDKVTYTWNNLDSGGNTLGTESVTYDLASAQVTSSSSTGNTAGFAFVTSVPEPASALLLLAAVPLLVRRRR